MKGKGKRRRKGRGRGGEREFCKIHFLSTFFLYATSLLPYSCVYQPGWSRLTYFFTWSRVMKGLGPGKLGLTEASEMQLLLTDAPPHSSSTQGEFTAIRQNLFMSLTPQHKSWCRSRRGRKYIQGRKEVDPGGGRK